MRSVPTLGEVQFEILYMQSNSLCVANHPPPWPPSPLSRCPPHVPYDPMSHSTPCPVSHPISLPVLHAEPSPVWTLSSSCWDSGGPPQATSLWGQYTHCTVL